MLRCAPPASCTASPPRADTIRTTAAGSVQPTLGGAQPELPAKTGPAGALIKPYSLCASRDIRRQENKPYGHGNTIQLRLLDAVGSGAFDEVLVCISCFANGRADSA